MDISLSSLSLETPPNRHKPPPGQENSITNPTDRAEEQRAEEMGSELWQEPVDFIAMVALVLEHDVPHMEMDPSTGLEPYSWQQKNMYVSYSLGEGASSFLELHSMRRDIILGDRSFRKGDRVALKRSFMEQFDDDIGVSPQQYDFVKRELRIFCHPKLRSHENICKLLFIGWEDYTPAPVLGLELAEYGTLKDLLFDADLSKHGSLGTHLVLDLALGLEALHDSEIVHGDVKTGNILVFSHRQRTIVAKLADFSDSVFLPETAGKRTLLGGTHHWRAPECYGTDQYDPKKTDVYSFGLCALAILAQGIWSKSINNTGPGDCFLTRIKEFDGMTKTEIQEMITAWKQDPRNQVLRTGLMWAENFGDEDEISKTNAKFVVSASLWCQAEKRRSISTIISGQFELLGSIGEQERYREYAISRESGGDIHGEVKTEGQNNVSELRMISVSNESLRARHPHFQKRLLDSLEKIAASALDLEFSEMENVLENASELKYSDLLSVVARNCTPIPISNIHQKTSARAIEAAAQLAECYCTGFGTNHDFQIAIKWLSISARAGRVDHCIYFSVIGDALGPMTYPGVSPLLRKTWLVLTASGGCSETLRILQDTDDDLYTLAKRIKHETGGALKRVLDPRETVIRLGDRLEERNLPIDHQFPPLGYTILHYAIAFGHEDSVKDILDQGANLNSLDLLGFTPLLLSTECGKGSIAKILLQRGADSCIGDRFSNFTPLHFLSYVDDENVKSLAKTMVKNVDQLQVISRRRGPVGLQNPYQSLCGTPLHWAATKPNKTLFAEILDLHLSYSSAPADLDEILETLASRHIYDLLRLLMTLVPKLRSSRNGLQGLELDKLLLGCVKITPGMRELMTHRRDFEKAKLKTIDVLLDAGADPFRVSATQENDPNNILQQLVIADELQVLKRFISFGEEHQLDLKAIFQDTNLFSGRNAFQRSIYCSSWNVFEFLAQSTYIDLDYKSKRGMTALHGAAINNDPRFIDVLLKLGCDPYARAADGRTPFQSAVFFKAFKSASRFLESDACSPEKLFAATPKTCNAAGFTLFGSVLSAAVTNYRHTVDFTTLRYLESVGAFTFTTNCVHNTTLLSTLVVQYPSIRPDYIAFDRALLEHVLSRAPPEVLNQCDAYGLAPLHWLVMRGNLPAITVLLTHPSSQSQIDINVETIEVQPTSLNPQPAEIGSNPGKTALNLAFLRRHNIPNLIKQGGQREIRQWGLRTEAIIETLQATGATLGSASSEADRAEAMGVNVVHPGDDVLGSLLVPVLGQRFRAETTSHQGVWPLRLAPRTGQSIEGVNDESLVINDPDEP